VLLQEVPRVKRERPRDPDGDGDDDRATATATATSTSTSTSTPTSTRTPTPSAAQTPTSIRPYGVPPRSSISASMSFRSSASGFIARNALNDSTARRFSPRSL